MPHSYAALCNDFYINQRLSLKMELPMRRDTVLAMFDRVRKQFPDLDQFKRFRNELALEAAPDHSGRQQWVAQRRSSVRSGTVNPTTLDEAFALHAFVLEMAPYFLDISPLDVEYLELLIGFDLVAPGNHDAIVFDALYAHSPLASVGDHGRWRPVDCQPMIGFELSPDERLAAHFEVKTRPGSRETPSGEDREDPISTYLTVRRHGPIRDIKELPILLESLRDHAEHLAETVVIPKLLGPLREVIASGSA